MRGAPAQFKTVSMLVNDERAHDLELDDARKTYDFGGAVFDLGAPGDRDIVRFILSQALYGEATGVYCGKSLYAAHSLEAAKFYVRQARQELAHLEMFGEIFRELDMTPTAPHWGLKLLSSHNNYYPLKVLMEHAIGEGMVLHVFQDLLLATLPDNHPGVPSIKKKLRTICRDESEHVAWGEKEATRLLQESPWLRTPFQGVLEIQMSVIPYIVGSLRKRYPDHPVMNQAGDFLNHVQREVGEQAKRLGFAPATNGSRSFRAWCMASGTALFLRSQLARSESKLDKTYLSDLGFPDRP